MATAAEILAAMEEEYIVIGNDRRITIPTNLKRLAVQFDHNIETVTFKCPRYWDNHDMSKMAIYVNYMRPDTYKDRYPVDNVKVEGDIMFFDWTISRNVTQVKGNISFLICVMKTDAEGNEERHWNSELSQEAYVSEGMECEESPVDIYPDLVTQLLLRMDSVEQINVQADEMQALYEATVEVANTAEEVKNQALDASGYIRNTYANAIKDTVSGEIIRVDDISPIEHDVTCRVHGKNYFDISKIFTTDVSTSVAYVSEVGSDYIIVTTNEGYTGNGFCTVSIKLRDVCPGLEVGKTYVLNAETESNSSNIYFPGILQSWVFGTTKVMTEEMLDSVLTFYGFSTLHNMGIGSCRISNIQIEEGTIATEYEPYIDPTTVTLGRCGKNLFNLSAIGSQGSVTNNGDGSVTVTASTSQPVEKFGEICPALKAGDVATLSFISENKDQNFIYLVGSKESWHNGTSKVLTQDALNGVMYFYSKKDTDGNGVATRIWNIQVEIGETVSTYEPYVEAKSETPVLDGTVDITSVSPTMTLYTDTPGVTIEVEYNVDTEKRFYSLVTEERIRAAVDTWLTAHYSSAEGVSF